MSVPIADYALLSDRHTAALVSRTGSVDWLCAPRFDSPSLFGRLLDPGAGHFSLRPLDAAADVERRYVDETMVLETTWTTATGTLVVLDALATLSTGGGDPHALGANAPRTLIRALECTAGQVEVAVEFAPRPEYGLVQPLLAAVPGGVMMRGGADVLALSCPVPLAVDSRAATGTLVLRAGEHATFGLTHRTTSEPYPTPCPPPSWTRRCARRWTPGGRGRGYTRATRARGATWCTTADGCCRRCPTNRPAPSWRPRPRRCPRRSAGNATGTTATPGCATRRSRWRRCGWPLAPTRPTSSSTTWPRARRPRSAAGVTCRSCSGWAANTTSPSASCATSRAGGTAAPCGWATAPGASARSTSTGSCSVRPTDSSPS